MSEWNRTTLANAPAVCRFRRFQSDSRDRSGTNALGRLLTSADSFVTRQSNHDAATDCRTSKPQNRSLKVIVIDDDRNEIERTARPGGARREARRLCSLARNTSANFSTVRICVSCRVCLRAYRNCGVNGCAEFFGERELAQRCGLSADEKHGRGSRAFASLSLQIGLAWPHACRFRSVDVANSFFICQ